MKRIGILFTLAVLLLTIFAPLTEAQRKKKKSIGEEINREEDRDPLSRLTKPY